MVRKGLASHPYKYVIAEQSGSTDNFWAEKVPLGGISRCIVEFCQRTTSSDFENIPNSNFENKTESAVLFLNNTKILKGFERVRKWGARVPEREKELIR